MKKTVDYNEFKHERFLKAFDALLEEKNKQDKLILFTILDYINHLSHRIKKLEEAKQ